MDSWLKPDDLVPRVEHVEHDVIDRYVSTINAANMAATWIVGEAAYHWKRETNLTWDDLAADCPGFSGSSLNTRALIYERFHELAEDLRGCDFGHFRLVLNLPHDEAVKVLFWVDRTHATQRKTEQVINRIRLESFDDVDRDVGLTSIRQAPSAPPAASRAMQAVPVPPEPPPPKKETTATKQTQTPEEYKALIGNDVRLPDEPEDPAAQLLQHLDAIMAFDVEKQDRKRVARKLREKADVLDPPDDSHVATVEDARGVARLWNMLENVRHVATLTNARLDKIKTRLSDRFWNDNYRAAMLRIDQIPGLCGENNRKWVANIDWFLRPDTVAKLMEGSYDQWGTDVSGAAWDDVFGEQSD
jgi:hypothetical protein